MKEEWKEDISSKQSYRLKDFSLKSWDDFITRGKTDDKLTQLYVKHYNRFSEAFELRNNMSIESQRKLLKKQRTVNPIYDL